MKTKLFVILIIFAGFLFMTSEIYAQSPGGTYNCTWNGSKCAVNASGCNIGFKPGADCSVPSVVNSNSIVCEKLEFITYECIPDPYYDCGGEGDRCCPSLLDKDACSKGDSLFCNTSSVCEKITIANCGAFGGPCCDGGGCAGSLLECNTAKNRCQGLNGRGVDGASCLGTGICLDGTTCNQNNVCKTPVENGNLSTVDEALKGECSSDDVIDPAIGCIPLNNFTKVASFVLGWSMGIAGAVAFGLSLIGGFQIMTSSGTPDRLVAGKELLASSVGGILLLIMSVLILRTFGTNILGIF